VTIDPAGNPLMASLRDFTVMRRLAMRFCGILGGGDFANLDDRGSACCVSTGCNSGSTPSTEFDEENGIAVAQK
jgi:hypothetical protein